VIQSQVDSSVPRPQTPNSSDAIAASSMGAYPILMIGGTVSVPRIHERPSSSTKAGVACATESRRAAQHLNLEISPSSAPLR